MLSAPKEGYLGHIVAQPVCSLPVPPRSSPPSRSLVINDEGVINSSKVLEVMSPQVSLETMGPTGVQDLPRYHSLLMDFREVADRWMAAGHLRGPANVGDGYLLELLIPISGEEGDFLLGQLDQEENSDKDSPPSYRG